VPHESWNHESAPIIGCPPYRHIRQRRGDKDGARISSRAWHHDRGEEFLVPGLRRLSSERERKVPQLRPLRARRRFCESGLPLLLFLFLLFLCFFHRRVRWRTSANGAQSRAGPNRRRGGCASSGSPAYGGSEDWTVELSGRCLRLALTWTWGYPSVSNSARERVRDTVQRDAHK
jgi:hypothetical protein